MVTFDELRQMALTFAEVEESTSYNTPAFKVRKKLIARLREDGFTLAIRALQEDIVALPQIDPETFSVPQHYVGYGMIVINLNSVRAEELRGLFAAAWQIAKPKKAQK
jgi:hypothetical protein